MTAGGVPGPGWYPDPWFTGQHRYWTGATWTGDVFPTGPTGHGATKVELRPVHERPPVAPPTERSQTPPPAPTFNYFSDAPTTVFAPWETLESWPAERSPRRWSRRTINIVAMATGLVVGFVVVAVVLSSRHQSSDASPPPPAAPFFPTAPTPSPSVTQPVDPDASVLQGLVVRQHDVESSYVVELLGGGRDVVGQTTLDLCNGHYPSEALRTARLQVVEYSPTGEAVLSTEAVLYRNPKSAQQAMQEVRSVVAHCPPDRPVVSPVNEPPVTTRFLPAPDGSWATVSGVNRAAYSFTTTDAFGVTDQRIAVYLQRGRVLEGVYFDTPIGAQPAVDGQTTVADIVHEFEQRIAALPRSVTDG